MTIYEIKERTQKTEPYFFSKDTMKFVGQTLKEFKVYKTKNGRFKIVAKSGNSWDYKHETIRYYNPDNNKLELT